MSEAWLFQISIFLFILTIIAVPFGEYMAKVFTSERTFLSPVLMPIENFLYRIFGVDPKEDMDWKTFVVNLLLFNLIGFLVLLILQEAQEFLPLNPQNFKAVRWDTALNTAVSYVTHTNWQSYKSETTMSYLTQMLGLGLHNFLSAGTSIAVAVAVINAFVGKGQGVGNFWVYLTRALIYILLPLAILLSITLISQGCIDNLKPYVHARTLEGKEQIIAQGPAASQIAIKHLGTNGGGFFAANSAHPYENPTALTDYLEIFSLLLIAAAFPFAFGALLNSRAQGWAIFIAMLMLFIISLGFIIWAEAHGSPLLVKLGIHNGINMEGKEVRTGLLSSVVFADATTATAAGAVNSLHDSFMPLAGAAAIFNITIGGAIFGGVGLGFIAMVFYAILTMFLVGLMIGKTPEIYGKKLEPYEMIMVATALFLPSCVTLILSAIAVSTPVGVASLGNPSSHGLSEIIYAYASSVGNNGSAFLGLNSNAFFYNLTTAFGMLFGRSITIISALAIAGSLAQKKSLPMTARFPTTSPVFILVLVAVVLIVGSLTFFPVLVLGPILEHLHIVAGQVF